MPLGSPVARGREPGPGFDEPRGWGPANLPFLRAAVRTSRSSCALLRGFLGALAPLLRCEAGRPFEEWVECLDRVRRHAVRHAALHRCVAEEILAVGPGDHSLEGSIRHGALRAFDSGVANHLSADSATAISFECHSG